jgi:hypothetical protein
MYNDMMLRDAARDVMGDEDDARYCEANNCSNPGAEWCLYEGRFLCQECRRIWDSVMEDGNE